MKNKIILVIIGVFILNYSYSSEFDNQIDIRNIIDLSNIKDKLILEYHTLLYSQNSDDITIQRIVEISDSLEIMNNELIKQFIDRLSGELGYAEISLLNIESSIEIIQSQCKKMRIIDWDSGLGGTMKQVISIVQYLTPEGTYVSQLLYNAGAKNYELRFNMFCDKIKLASINNKLYYLVSGTGKFESHKKTYILNVFKIDGFSLNSNCKIVLDQKGINSNHIFITKTMLDKFSTSCFEYDSINQLVKFLTKDDINHSIFYLKNEK